MFRVHERFRSRLTLDGPHNKTRDTAERLGHVVLLQGARRRSNVPELRAGDLGAVPKLKDTLTGDTLGDKIESRRLSRRSSIPEPVLVRTPSRAEEPRRRTESARRDAVGWTGRKILVDPATSRDPQHEGVAAGRARGQLHIEVTVSRLKRRYNVEVTLAAPKASLSRDHSARARRFRDATKSRPAAMGNSATAGFGWSRSSAARISSSRTRFSAAQYHGSTSRLSKRE